MIKNYTPPRNFYKILLVIMFLTLSTASWGFAPGNLDIMDDTAEIPLDGGVSLLIAAGVAYGAKKIRDYRKNKTE